MLFRIKNCSLKTFVAAGLDTFLLSQMNQFGYNHEMTAHKREEVRLKKKDKNEKSTENLWKIVNPLQGDELRDW